MPTPTPSFDLLVVGAGGGPNENNLSGYLLKAHDRSWSDGVVGIEAGSGLGALKRILQENPDLLSEPDRKSLPPDAIQIYTNLKSYLITHSHLDHVLSLVLLAGGTEGPRKSIRGSRQCLQGLETLFKPGRVWPNLASWKRRDLEELYLYDPLPDEVGVYTSLTDDLSVSMYPLSHGPETLSSAFFLRHTPTKREFLFFGDVEPDKLASSSPSSSPSSFFSASPGNADGYNAHIWRVAAPKIATNRLNTIFIECSWPAGRKDRALYGHLSPGHLVEELEMLAEAVASCRDRGHEDLEASSAETKTRSTSTTTGTRRKRAASDVGAPPARKRQRFDDSDEESSTVSISPELVGALTGIRIFIVHCKEDMEGKYPGQLMHVVISEQVRTLVEERRLGATVMAVEQGQLIHI